MKTILPTLLITTVLLCSFMQSFAEDQPITLYWYEVVINKVEKSFGYYGSSTLPEDKFVKQAETQKFLKLDNVHYYWTSDDLKTWTVKKWNQWNPLVQNRIYINTATIITIMPMARDPRELREKEIKINK